MNIDNPLGSIQRQKGNELEVIRSVTENSHISQNLRNKNYQYRITNIDFAKPVNFFMLHVLSNFNKY